MGRKAQARIDELQTGASRPAPRDYYRSVIADSRNESRKVLSRAALMVRSCGPRPGADRLGEQAAPDAENVAVPLAEPQRRRIGL